MARIKIDLPSIFPFTTSIPIRVTDINYGNHVGNDTILSLMHEARVRFFGSHGYEELQFEGVGLIMSSAAIEYKSELFYGDKLNVSVAATAFSKVSFEVYYKLEKELAGVSQLVAIGQTEMVCYDYALKKIVRVPANAVRKLSGAST